MTLTEFLLARIAEDEKAADLDEDLGHISSDGYARALRDCEAKRELVKLFGYAESFDTAHRVGWYPAVRAIRSLASVYSDHPDYLPEWQLGR